MLYNNPLRNKYLDDAFSNKDILFNNMVYYSHIYFKWLYFHRIDTFYLFHRLTKCCRVVPKTRFS